MTEATLQKGGSAAGPLQVNEGEKYSSSSSSPWCCCAINDPSPFNKTLYRISVMPSVNRSFFAECYFWSWWEGERQSGGDVEQSEKKHCVKASTRKQMRAYSVE